ncbi:MAG: response regulator [Gemmatimonadota bacterium]|nr:response regulator [Gemmatimonadota bacterium]
MIQIIEDDLVTCHIISALLKRMRYAYCEAHTGAEALQQLKSQPIDMVIADMMLPDMNGLDLLKEKHNLPYLRDIPVLCCTAQADIETVEAALGYGAIDFVKKPIAIQSFAGRINRAMERSPVRWESWREMSKRLRFYSRTIQPMLAIASQVLHELGDTLGEAQTTAPDVARLNSAVTRARGAALNVGAVRTVQQIDKLWKGEGAAEDIENLRAAIVIELASFDDAIRNRAAQGEAATLPQQPAVAVAVAAV